jgi:hypothetical protein
MLRAAITSAAITAVILFATLTASAAAAGPVIFRAMDPVGPGETALLFGDAIGAGVTAEGWRLDDAAVSGPPAPGPALPAEKGRALEVLQASDVCAKILIPADWKPGVYVIRLRNEAGVSSPIFLNRADPWWWLAGPNDTASPGQNLRIFGKDFGAATQAWLGAGGKALALVATPPSAAGLQRDKYAATLRLPETLAPGDYDLWVHNGLGGNLGFGGPLKVKVVKADPWPTTLYNVRDSGAAGDETTDDTAAFQAALDKAGAAGGGIVFVPRGTYKITGKLIIPARTTLRGEKREWVWLYAPKDLPEFDTILAGNGDFAVEDLSIVSQTARRLVVCPDHPNVYQSHSGHSPPPDKWGRNAHLRRLRLQQLRYAHRIQKDDPLRLEQVGPSTVTLVGPDMEISDCDIVSAGMPFALHEMRHARIERNRLGTGRQGWYGIWGAEECVFAGNLIEARDLEGSYGGVQGKTWRVYFAGNRWADAYGDEREALTFDTPYYPTWMGRVGTLAGTTLTTRDYAGAEKTWKPDELRGQVCLIAFGKGLGQYIRILGNTETTLTLERPWAVVPDAGSHLVVRADKSEVVITGNVFSDASAAVQLYAQSFGFIIDGNKSVRTGGMYGIGTDSPGQKQRRRYSTCSFNQWLNNDLSEGFVYQQGSFMHGIVGPCAGGGTLDPPAITTMGNIVRGNTARDHFTLGALYFGNHPLTPGTTSAGCYGRDTIVENNVIADTPLALEVYPLYIDTVLRGNRVTGAAVPLSDDGTRTWIHPAERLAYQVAAVKAMLGAEAHLAPIEAAVAALAKSPAASPDVAAACTALHRQLWAEVARAWPRGVTREVVLALVGLRYEFSSNSSVMRALSTGAGGKADATVSIRTEPWAPEVAATAQILPPEGWKDATASETATLKPATIATLKAPVTPPAGALDRALPVRITVALGGVPLTVDDRFDVSQRDVLKWMVIGPFANTSKVLPDLSPLEADARLDFKATYAGIGGKVKWQPVTLPNRWLHLDQLLHPTQPATALAVTCLRVEKPVTASLSFSCRGGMQVWLNGKPLATLPGPSGGKSVQVNLVAGDNTIFVKTSYAEGPWEITAEVRDLSPGPSPILQVPEAAKFTRPAP